MDDETTFRSLFHANYEHLLCFVERRIHPLVAEDVVAEVFLVAWRRLEQVPAPAEEARAWLFAVAHRTLANQRRSNIRHQGLLTRVGQGLAAHPSEADHSPQVAAQVDLARAWTRLSSSDQEVLTLTGLDGLSGPHAAQVLSISATAFSVRLLRARRRLHLHLAQPARRPERHAQARTPPPTQAQDPLTIDRPCGGTR